MTEAAEQLSETNKWLPCSRSKRACFWRESSRNRMIMSRRQQVREHEERRCISEKRHIS